MSKTLNLFDQLLSRGQQCQHHGLDREATGFLGKLASFRSLPPDVAEETQVRLGELAFGRRDFKQARRHFAAALTRRPEEAEYHYLMAIAIEEDKELNQAGAGRSYRQAIAFDPDNPVFLADYGQYLIACGKAGAGLRFLRQAAQAAPDDAEILSQVADGLRSQNKVDEAGKMLQLALFRNSQDDKFRDLWDKHQFQVLHQSQQKATLPPDVKGDEEPNLLPFVRPQSKKDKPGHRGDRRVIRIDSAENLPGPKLPARKTGNRRKAK